MSYLCSARIAARALELQPSAIRELSKRAREPGMISFAGGTPDPALFPFDQIAAWAAGIFADESRRRECLQYGLSEGYAPLRAMVESYLRTKGIESRAADVLITTGSQQGLEFAGKLFINPGDRVIVTRPTYLGALQAFSLCQPRYVAVGQTSDGLDLAQLERALAEGARFLYLVPDFANPSGLSLPLANRVAVLELAHRHGVPIVEDQAYEELLYDGERLPTLLELAQRAWGPEQALVIYLGTFSKVLAPGLRVGWVLAPPEIHRIFVSMKQAADLHGSGIDQMIVAEISPAFIAAHAEKLRAVYRVRRDAMVAALGKYAPRGTNWSTPRGGMFVWLTLPEAINATGLAAQAADAHKVLFVPGASFHTDGSGVNTARLSFAMSAPEIIEEGVQRLCRAIRELI